MKCSTLHRAPQMFLLLSFLLGAATSCFINMAAAPNIGAPTVVVQLAQPVAQPTAQPQSQGGDQKLQPPAITLHQLMSGVTDGTYKLIRRVVKTTGYAPLDPKAVRGMCYSGDPKITASGRQVMPGVTIAADRSIPFGTWIWIDSLGWRRVDDRGGAIKGGRLDICFATRAEALAWGVKHKTVVIVMPQQ